MSPHDLASFPPYQALLNDRLRWISQSYGDVCNRAIAFRPLPGLTGVALEAAYERVQNLFVNHDPRPRNAPPFDCPGVLGEYPAPPEFCWVYDILYVNMTENRLRATLVNYFRAALPSHLGKTVKVDDPEDEDATDFVYDEQEVQRVAEQCADHFIAHEIQVNCFLPNPDRFVPDEHGISFFRSEPVAQVETLADAAVA